MAQAVLAGRREIVEALIERIDVRKSDTPPGWTAEIHLVINEDGSRSKYANDWCRKYVL